MTAGGPGRSDEAPRVHVDIDNAEQLVQTSSAHARGELDDAEFLDRREHLLTEGAEAAAEE
jgi:hypothetical protein